MLDLRSLTELSNGVLECFLIDLVNRISFKRKVKRNFGTSKCRRFEGPLGNVLRTSWRRPEPTSLGRPLKVRLGCPLDVILGRRQDVRSGRPWDGHIGPVGDVLGTLEGDVLGTSWGPIFAGRKQIRESDLQVLIQFVEEETTLMNDPLFSREALHEYTKGPEKQNQRRLKQMKNCLVKTDKEKDVCNSSGLKSSLKCQFCDGNHDLDNCQFYNELSVEVRSSFLKKNKLS